MCNKGEAGENTQTKKGQNHAWLRMKLSMDLESRRLEQGQKQQVRTPDQHTRDGNENEISDSCGPVTSLAFCYCHSFYTGGTLQMKHWGPERIGGLISASCPTMVYCHRYNLV